jgi:very-short-patch-repair endonuclease
MRNGDYVHLSHRERAIAALARRQHGYVTSVQLRALGLSSDQIKYRVAVGRLISVYHGVHAVGHLPTLPIDRAAGAVLACEPDGLLSHGSAMCLWGWWKRWELPFEVTARSARRRRGIRFHRSETLTRRDIAHRLGIRVTSPARTVFDVAPRLNDRQLRRAVQDASHSKLLRLDDLAELLTRHPRHRAARRLRAFVELPQHETRSVLEDDWTLFAGAYGFDGWRMNVPMGRRILDVLFETERVIVELDGWDSHSSRISFEDDRDRDADHLELGYVTVRITKERMRSTPAHEAERLHAILAARRE